MAYVEACMDPDQGAVPTNYEVTTDSALLQDLVRALDALIPWMGDDEEEKLTWVVNGRREMPFPPLQPESSDAIRRAVIHWREQIRQTQQLYPVPTVLLDHQRGLVNQFETVFAAWRRRFRKFQASEEDAKEAHRRLAEIKECKVKHQIKKNWVKRLLRDLLNSDDWPRFKQKIRKLPWVILPGGEADWQLLLNHAHQNALRLSERVLQPERLRLLHQRQPSEIYTGSREFEGYYVFVFKRSGKAVFECPWKGNAAFVVEGQWMALSQLTKSQLENRPEAERIIHSSSGHWKNRLLTALCRPPRLQPPFE